MIDLKALRRVAASPADRRVAAAKLRTIADALDGAIKQAGEAGDPEVDATGFRVARDGNGNWYLVDLTTDPPTVSRVQFGDVVAQQGTPAGSKRRNIAGMRLRSEGS